MSGKSDDTVERRLNAGKFPNAKQDEDGRRTWRIPIKKLVFAGLLPSSRFATRPCEANLSGLDDCRKPDLFEPNNYSPIAPFARFVC